MIDLEALLRTRAKWERRAFGIFTAAFEDERRDVLAVGRRGFDSTRWLAALRVVWEGAADDWIPQVQTMLITDDEKGAYFFLGGAGLTQDKGAVIDEGLAEELVTILAGKAEAIVELTEEQWLLLGDEALTNTAARAGTLATTESTEALAWGQHQTAVKVKLVLLKIWQAILDDRTRDTHRTANGQRRRINDPFNVGGAALQWPADAGGPLGEIINCRCWEDYEQVPVKP